MNNNINNINKIEEKIHTIYPEFTKETLDLFYEYIITKYTESFKHSNDLSDLLEGMCNPF